jgi:hypothetical protein
MEKFRAAALIVQDYRKFGSSRLRRLVFHRARKITIAANPANKAMDNITIISKYMVILS